MPAGKSVSKCGTTALACRTTTSRSCSSRSLRPNPWGRAPDSACPAATASSTPTGARRAITTTSGVARRSSSSSPWRIRPPADRTAMTERLYYTDAYLREFDASVTRVDRRDGRAVIFLDRTAFYPTSGGQPFDVGCIAGPERAGLQIGVGGPFPGRLNGNHLIDEAGDIAHVVDGELAAGDRVHGAIDWTRRFDHMQQHTGQHVLSAAIDRLFGVRTVSFHLGT